MTLGEKLYRLRKEKGWTQERLAEQIGVSRQALSKWESGSAVPDAVNILRLSKLFAVSADYLLDDAFESSDATWAGRPSGQARRPPPGPFSARPPESAPSASPCSACSFWGSSVRYSPASIPSLRLVWNGRGFIPASGGF